MKLSALGHQNWGMTYDARRALEARMESMDALISRGVGILDDKGASPSDRMRLIFNGGNPIVAEIVGEVATIEILGDIIARAPWYAKAYMDGVDPFDVADAVDALALNDAVKSLVIEMDCCGGTIAGTAEAAAALTRFQGKGKTIEVRAAGVIASAAYWMVAGADRIVATPTTHVGSLGVYNLLIDETGALHQSGMRMETIVSAAGKGLGTDGRITPAQRDQVQRRVDSLVAVFRDAVGANRGLTGAALDAVFTGDTWLAGEALTLGLIDAVASPADELDQAKGDTPPPALVVPIPLPGDSTESAKSSITPPAAAGSQESNTMDKALMAALAALTETYPTHAAALVKAAQKEGATADGLKAMSSDLVAQATGAELATVKASLAAAEKRATDAEAAKAKADADLIAAKAHGQTADPKGGDETIAKDVRRIPIADSAKLTKNDLADIQAGKAALV
jgi:ClpP class serine protease